MKVETHHYLNALDEDRYIDLCLDHRATWNPVTYIGVTAPAHDGTCALCQDEASMRRRQEVALDRYRAFVAGIDADPDVEGI